MAFIIFIISIVFSFIFYIFYLWANSKSLFWYELSFNGYFSTLSFSPIIDSIIFIILWVFFYMYFSGLFFRKNKPEKYIETIPIINIKSLKLNKKYLFFFLSLILFLIFFWYIFHKFLNKDFSLFLVYLFFIFSIWTYIFTIKKSSLNMHNISLTKLSIIFSYFCILIWLTHTFSYSIEPKIILIIFFSCLFNLYIHNKFENYISFFFWIFSINSLFYILYYHYFFSLDDGLIFISLSLFLCIEIVIITFFYRFKNKTDYFFLHYFSYILNILSLMTYFFLFKIDLFIIAVIFFIEVIYLLLSYYKLKQINKEIW